MGAIGIYDPVSGRNIPLDELEKVDRTFPVKVIVDMLEGETEEPRHQGASLTVTSGMGCPRRLLIERFTDTYPDVQKKVAAYLGGKLHESAAEIYYDLDRGDGDGWVVEFGRDRERCEFKGVLFGYPMTCRVDGYYLVDGVVTRIRDYKFTFGGSDKWVDVHRRARDVHAAQLNMCRLLMIQSGMKVSDDVVMEAHVVGGSYQPTYAPVMYEGECSVVRVGGSRWTIGELVEVVMKGFAHVESGGDVKEFVNGLPMYGEGMFVSKKGTNMCSAHCAVERDCKRINGVM